MSMNIWIALLQLITPKVDLNLLLNQFIQQSPAIFPILPDIHTHTHTVFPFTTHKQTNLGPKTGVNKHTHLQKSRILLLLFPCCSEERHPHISIIAWDATKLPQNCTRNSRLTYPNVYFCRSHTHTHNDSK